MPTETNMQDPILAAARTVIDEQGTNKATISAVARQAGLSRMTVYRRFESWDAILSALLSQELAQLLEQATANPPQAATACEHAVHAAVLLTDAIGRNTLFRRMTEQEPQWLLPLLTTRFGQTQRAAAGKLEQLLKSGMTEFEGDGSVRNDDPAVMALTCLMLSQPFVFAAPALADHPSGERVRAELPMALSSYLSGQPRHPGAQPKE